MYSNSIQTEEKKVIVLDIETIGNDKLSQAYIDWKTNDKVPKNYKDPFKIEEAKKEAAEKFGLSPRSGKIVHIGICNNFNFEGVSEKHFRIGSGEEKDLLESVWSYIHNAFLIGADMVTFNGKAFDLPYMIMRSMISGANKPVSLSMAPYLKKTFPGQESHHIDLYEFVQMSDGGSLNEWTYITGLQSEELENRGSEIQAMWDAGDYDGIEKKNSDDIKRTMAFYNLAKGWL